MNGEEECYVKANVGAKSTSMPPQQSDILLPVGILKFETKTLEPHQVLMCSVIDRDVGQVRK